MSIDRTTSAFSLKEQDRPKGVEGLQGLNGINNQEAKDLALKRAAKEFESLFIFEMLKAMRKTVPEDGLFKGITGKDTYMTMVDQQLASALAERGGIGLADILLKHMEPGIAGGHKMPPGFTPPVEGGVVSSPFGVRKHPILGHMAHHSGLDIASPAGSEIHATAGGRVIFSGTLANYGNTVMLEHDGGYVSLYAHNQSNAVELDQEVAQGEVIGQVGSTGRSTGPHVHFELRLLGTPVDPQAIMVASSDGSSKKS